MVGSVYDCGIVEALFPRATYQSPHTRPIFPICKGDRYKSQAIIISQYWANTLQLDLTESEARVTELTGLMSSLPLPNYCLLRALTAHLILIIQNSSVNKTTMRHIGITFSPTLGIPAGVFSLMLSEFARVFTVDAGFDGMGLVEPISTQAPSETGPKNSDELSMVHPSQRNSHSYAETSAHLSLRLTGRPLQRKQ